MARQVDPRPAITRARLLDAAASLLRSGGPSAVTVDAVTNRANVARATVYRHFRCGNDLLAAAFVALIPEAGALPEGGSLRDRLTAVLIAQAELIAEAPMILTAMTWMALRDHIGQVLNAHHFGKRCGHEVRGLRTRIAEQFILPLNAIFDSPQAEIELGEVDRTVAIPLLLRPVLIGTLSAPGGFDYHECAGAAVDGFLATYAKNARRLHECTTS